MYQPSDVISTAAEIRDLLGDILPSQVNKIIDQVDHHCQTWIERSPFVVVTTADKDGRIDVSPKGDPPGFVKVLDRKTLAIPDRPGNHRADSFVNIIQNPRIGLMFVVPQRSEVVRVSGTAQLVRDQPLLESMAINTRVPQLAILVHVEEAFFHCGKAMVRSRMWQPDHWASIEGLPSYAQALIDHGNPPYTLAELEQRTAANERDRLY